MAGRQVEVKADVCTHSSDANSALGLGLRFGFGAEATALDPVPQQGVSV
jgi:hypothetical protein